MGKPFNGEEDAVFIVGRMGMTTAGVRWCESERENERESDKLKGIGRVEKKGERKNKTKTLRRADFVPCKMP
jgi:hypothetical protein